MKIFLRDRKSLLARHLHTAAFPKLTYTLDFSSRRNGRRLGPKRSVVEAN